MGYLTEQHIREAMTSRGITPPSSLVMDGKIHRFDPEGKGKNKDGFYMASPYSACFGDWSRDLKEKIYPDQRYFSSEEKQKCLKAQKIQNNSLKEEIKRRHEVAAVKAQKQWNNAHDQPTWNSDAEKERFDYLSKKKVQGYGLKYEGHRILVPIRDISGQLRSLQEIDLKRDSPYQKMILPRGAEKQGHFHLMGKALSDGEKILVCEGYATGASLFEATGITTIVAIDSGNLDPVIGVIRSHYHNLDIYIAADDDCYKPDKGNIGREKAEAAAKKYNCFIIYPTFQPLDYPHTFLKGNCNPTDFNDLHYYEGLDAVQQQINQAIEKTKEQKELNALAALSTFDYEKIRAQKAKDMGVRPSVLDQVVKDLQREQKEHNKEEDVYKEFPEWKITPWETSVCLEELLEDLITTLNRFACLPPYANVTLALWVIFTYFIQESNCSPILALSSPEKRCGKTTVFKLLNALVSRNFSTSNIQPAALFRSIEKWQPTFLIDEGDTFISSSDELKGIINSGHTKTSAYVVRCVGDNHEPKRFNTWGAKAIALIGHLPDTIADRSITINLKRKTDQETIESQEDENEHIFHHLKRKIYRFYLDNKEGFKEMKRIILPFSSDRDQNNWDSLLKISSFASIEWQKKIQEAALTLSNTKEETHKTPSVELLEDIKTIFDTKNLEKISTQQLLRHLLEDEEAPWVTWNRGKPINPKQISKMLSKFGIKSKTIRIGLNTAKGFEKDQFEDAWKRYLVEPPKDHQSNFVNTHSEICGNRVTKSGDYRKSVDDSVTDNIFSSVTSSVTLVTNSNVLPNVTEENFAKVTETTRKTEPLTENVTCDGKNQEGSEQIFIIKPEGGWEKRKTEDDDLIPW